MQSGRARAAALGESGVALSRAASAVENFFKKRIEIYRDTPGYSPPATPPTLVVG